MGIKTSFYWFLGLAIGVGLVVLTAGGIGGNDPKPAEQVSPDIQAVYTLLGR